MINITKELRENNKIEFKSANGGLPSSIWETYSAFSNTNGGYIILGLTELKDKSFISSHLTIEQINKLKIDFFNLLNNKQKVNLNLIKEENVYIDYYDDSPILIIKVDEADYRLKPIYLNNNINLYTFRRNHEGDYRCDINDIKSMLIEASIDDLSLEVLNDLPVNALNMDVVNQYRIKLENKKPNHPFLNGNNEAMLEKIGAISLGEDNKYHPTKAGLLMFGNSYKIVFKYPSYFLDYQEHYEDIKDKHELRYTNRIHSDSGTFSGSIFEFYTLVENQLTKDLPTPFKMNGIYREDENDLYKAVREALCNALSNEDYLSSIPVTIKKYKDRIVFKNGGISRIKKDIAIKGGSSDPRNKTILKMFALIGIGERVGSGIPFIFNAAKEFNFSTPSFNIDYIEQYTELTFYLNNVKKEIKKEKEEVKLSKKDESILNFIATKEKVSVKDISLELNIKPETIKYSLYKLLKLNKIKSEGTIKNKEYMINLL